MINLLKYLMKILSKTRKIFVKYYMKEKNMNYKEISMLKILMKNY